MPKGCDMIVGLYNLPSVEVDETIKIKRAFVGDKEEILAFVREHFSKSWIYETYYFPSKSSYFYFILNWTQSKMYSYYMIYQQKQC